MYYFIDFEPVGRRGACPAGSTLLDCARLLGVGLVNVCGGAGDCGTCVVQVMEGEVSAPGPQEGEFLRAEQISQGFRLACRVTPLSDCRVSVPLESLLSAQRTQIEGEETAVRPDPAVAAFPVTLAPATLNDLRADAERLIDALKEQHSLRVTTVDIDVLRHFSTAFRQSINAGETGWRGQAAVRGDEVVGLLPTGAPALGLAVDLGTTKIAAYLVELSTGRTLASRGLMNPQIAYGEDVIARITLADREAGKAGLLHDLVSGALNQVAAEMCESLEAKPEHIVDAVIVGNTAMHHLLLTLPVRQLARAPYVPAVASPLDLKARDLGLQLSPGCYVHIPAVVAGFVGADHVAMLLATEIERCTGVALAIDIGTNTEVCLCDRGDLTSASCASGPAFEGAHIKHGMRAARGVIERMRLVDDRVEVQTIGDAPPVGLCGSGIVDAMAQLLLAGVLDRNGRMHDHPRVREVDGVREFVLVDESQLAASDTGDLRRGAITFTQHDVRQLQLAKGAIRAGIELLLDSRGREARELDSVVIAGAFGTYIDVGSAIAIGMLPDLPVERVRQVGNAAGMGAKRLLISRTERRRAADLAGRVHYLELAAHRRFADAFARSMLLDRA